MEFQENPSKGRRDISSNAATLGPGSRRGQLPQPFYSLITLIALINMQIT